MVQRLWQRTTRAALLAVAVLVGTSAQAADTSLGLVPADAGFYSAMLRNKEQVDLLVNSKAFQAVWNLPQVQANLKKAHDEFNKDKGELAQVRQFLESPLGKDVVATLTDAVSDEVFLYGSDALGGTIQLAMTVYNNVQYGPLMAMLDGKGGGLDPSEIQAYYALKGLAAHLDLVKVPDFTIGFKVKDAARAEKLIGMLEQLGTQALKQAPPPLQGRLKRTTVGKSNLLTVNLDGSLVPWERVPIKDLEQKAGEFADLAAKLKQLTLTVSLGVHEGYLVLGVGPSTAQIAKLSGAGPLLKDAPEFKLLAKAGSNKLTDVNYSSKSYLTKLSAGNVEQFDKLLDLAKAGLAVAPLPEERKAAILKDVEALVKGMKGVQPTYGAALSFNFLTARGTEGFAYDWTKYPAADGSKPLTLFNHVGEKPILAVVGRTKGEVESYKAVAQFARTAYGHLTALAADNIPDDDNKKRFAEATKAVEALAKKFDTVTTTLLYPATADGQSGFVVDGKWASKEWVKGVAFDKEMPMLEIGILTGLSDSGKFVQAMNEYRKLINEAISEFGRIVPEANIPPALELPLPEKKAVGNDALYFYPLGETPLDKRVQPTFGVGKDVFVIAASAEHATRLLASKPFKPAGGPLAARIDKPLSGGSYADMNALLDVFSPWAEFGIRQVLAQEKADKKTVDDSMAAFQAVLRLFKCVKESSTATYAEDGATVTHSETVVKDID